MKYLVMFLVMAVLAGCAGTGEFTTGVGSVKQSQGDLTLEWQAYYAAKQAQMTPTEIVRLELDPDGRVGAIVVNQAPDVVDVQPPKKYYSAGWETANKFVDGMWSTVRFAVPGAAAWATADAIGRIADRPNVTNSYNQPGGDYAGGDYAGPVDQSSVNNSNQGNPVDNSNQGNPVDSSDNRTNYGNEAPVVVPPVIVPGGEE